MNILLIFKILGLSSFMLTGALVAIKNKMDLAGVIFLAAISGLGGGTIRDILLQIPIFWMQHNWYLYLALVIGVVTFYFYHTLKKYITRRLFEKALELFDVLGATSFMIMSVSSAKLSHQSTMISIVLSVITCIGGGALRDIICGEIPVVFKSELYATSVVLGSSIYIAVEHFNTNLAIAFACIFLISFRFTVSHFKIRLPKKSFF